MSSLPELYKCNVAIVGLGYVGLPLAIEIAKNEPCVKTANKCSRRVIGYDINKDRLNQLSIGQDNTNEISKEDLEIIKEVNLTSNPKDLDEADVYIVTVPTPIDEKKKPELSALLSASEIVGNSIARKFNLKNQTLPLVIYESTVYPGVVEDICIPKLESSSNLKISSNFSCGYSPERINPGDTKYKLRNIVKVTSGYDELSANWIDKFYSSFITAGTHKAESIKVAEAAKVIENTQRDINISLTNELAIICRFLGIDTLEVLKAANTKWNFLDFKPGLVGGHCIGVDPYYLTYKAELLGYKPKVILAGRRMNDSIGSWITNELIKILKTRYLSLKGLKILILGITFKENCPDIRNTGVINIINSLKIRDIDLDIVDPIANSQQCKKTLNVDILREIPKNKKFNSVIVAVAHKEFINFSKETWQDLITEGGEFLDIKGIIPRSLNAIRL